MVQMSKFGEQIAAKSGQIQLRLQEPTESHASVADVTGRWRYVDQIGEDDFVVEIEKALGFWCFCPGKQVDFVGCQFYGGFSFFEGIQISLLKCFIFGHVSDSCHVQTLMVRNG